jgi:hypothetical protein
MNPDVGQFFPHLWIGFWDNLEIHPSPPTKPSATICLQTIMKPTIHKYSYCTHVAACQVRSRHIKKRFVADDFLLPSGGSCWWRLVGSWFIIFSGIGNLPCHTVLCFCFLVRCTDNLGRVIGGVPGAPACSRFSVVSCEIMTLSEQIFVATLMNVQS